MGSSKLQFKLTFFTHTRPQFLDNLYHNVDEHLSQIFGHSWTSLNIVSTSKGPKMSKNASNLGGFRPKLPQFTTIKPPELRNRVSWEHLHKMLGQLNHRGPNHSQSPTPLYDPVHN